MFKTGFFFKPAIVFGSKEAIEEYRAFEASLPADEALPETFRELHTAYGALRQSGKEHKARGSARSVRACVFMTMRVCVRKTVRVCERGRLCGCVRERLCVCVSERACVRVRVCLSLRVVCETPWREATRANFGKVLGRAALAHYAPIIARQTRDFVQGELMAKSTLQPG